MKKGISPIIQANELLKLCGKKKLILIDAGNGENARANYVAKHLAGAIFLDLNTQLAKIEEDLSKGGRHPLTKIENFIATIAKVGIDNEKHIVIYDDKNGANAAARLWWMLSALGLDQVQVLNGGIQVAEHIGYPIRSGEEQCISANPLPIDHWTLPIADMEEVEGAAEQEQYKVIDVREAKRYNGEIEPIDLIAGHIPGAINVPYAENLDDRGLFLDPNILKEKYEKVFGDVDPKNVIFHCGSGVTACHSILAVAYAGFELPKLYVGSWSEWSRNEKKMVCEISHLVYSDM